jgi:hypothetical protein
MWYLAKQHIKQVSHKKMLGEKAASIKGSLKKGSLSPPLTLDLVISSALSYIRWASSSETAVLPLRSSTQVFSDFASEVSSQEVKRPKPTVEAARAIFFEKSLLSINQILVYENTKSI